MRRVYCRLKERYRLRGWERLPFAIQDVATGGVLFLDEKAFQAASFCNGMVDVASPLLLPAHRRAVALLKEQGIVEECAFGEEVKEEQKYRLIPCRYMRKAHWSITGRCNLKCRHCFMSAPHAKYGELSLEKCLDIVRQIAEAGILDVSLTGGEPLVRDDFFEIVDALRAESVTISQVYTNGVLVDEALLNGFEARGIRPEFSLSFDGIGCHDWLRGVAGAERKAVDAIGLLRSRDFPVSIETALYRGNLHTLPTSLELFAGLGVESWKATPATDAGEWLNEKGRYTLSIEELYEAYLDFIPRFKAAGAPLTLMLGGFFLCRKGEESWRIPCRKFDGSGGMLRQTVCGSARNTMYISADGKLLPCIPLSGMPLQEEMPDITKTPLCEALSDSKYLSLIDTRLEDLLKENERCAACEHRLSCGGGCRAGALAVGNDYLGVDESTCLFFKNGYEERIRAAWGGNAAAVCALGCGDSGSCA